MPGQRLLGDNGPVTDAPATDEALDPEIARLLKRDAAGLVAAVIQEESTGRC